MRVHALQLHRAAPQHFRGLMGLGLCTPMGTKYSNTPNGACLDSTNGSVVDCLAAACSAAAPVAAAGAGPNFTPTTTIQDIVVGGFSGEIAVPTLASALSQAVASKESPFIANVIAKGADSVAAENADIATQGQAHCTEYPASDGCDDLAALVAQYQAQYMAWAQGQSASTYQSADTGTLVSPLAPSAGGGSAPVVYTAPAAAAAPSASGSGSSSPGTVSPNTTTSKASPAAAAAPFSWAFLTDEAISGIPNWVLGVGVVAGLIALSMFSGGRR